MKKFDRNLLELKSLKVRHHGLDLSIVKSLETLPVQADSSLAKVAKDLVNAKIAGRSMVFFMGGHVVRSGVQRYLIDLMKRGYISCLAMNGAGVIHDFELALIGKTTESVARYISEGQFGLWQETGTLNEIVNQAFANDCTVGFGGAVGEYILGNNLPHKEVSLLAAARKFGVPATVHVGIGSDIIHEHPNFDGAATGAMSYHDFLFLAQVVSGLEGGVVMNFGSAVMAPEVYLKALSMARNVAKQEGRFIRNFTSLVCDLVPLPEDLSTEPSREDHAYYFRPLKTMLIRTVAEGGKGYYVRGNHAETIPALWSHINFMEKGHG